MPYVFMFIAYDPLRRLKQQRLLNNKINKQQSSFEAAK